MCTTCGCGHTHSHDHDEIEHRGAHHTHNDDGARNDSNHGFGHDAAHLHFGRGPARAHAPGLSQARMVQIERDILEKNDHYAAANRALFESHGMLTLNLVSSPGSGKTTLLTATIRALHGRAAMAVIEGDQQTVNDAERIRETGVPAIQINTGKGCHLDAHMIGHAVERLSLVSNSVLFIENVGNLVCPAGFDLGEAHKVAILSVTEGDDKPLKYPDMFAAADLMILNKIDLLPFVDFDVDRCVDYARRINPDIEVLELSARNGAGMNDWYDWILAEKARRLSEVEVPETMRAK